MKMRPDFITGFFSFDSYREIKIALITIIGFLIGLIIVTQTKNCLGLGLSHSVVNLMLIVTSIIA